MIQGTEMCLLLRFPIIADCRWC